jgi:hypothetical protein
MRLLSLDRRIIYILVLLAVGVPLLFRVSLPVKVGVETRKVHSAIDNIPQGSYVMLSFDIEASSLPEVKPLAEATVRHCFQRDLRIIGLALFSEGAAIGYNLLVQVADEMGKVYGSDYIYLGFRPQYVSAILGMGESIEDVFPLDYLNNDWREYPGYASLGNYDDVALVISIADGSLPTYWVEYAGSRYNQKIAACLTAAMTTSYYPYTVSGQLVGMVSGLKGAAEYETMLGYSGGGHRGMLSQSSGHALIILLVIVANVAELRKRK